LKTVQFVFLLVFGSGNIFKLVMPAQTIIPLVFTE